MFEKTTGIVLRLTPFSRTSLVAIWLTPDHGRTATLLKGAERPKSDFLGQVDLFYTCEIVFYRHAHNALHLLKECTPLVTRDNFRRAWRASGIASYFCDLVGRIASAAAPQETAYRLLTRSLDWTARNKPSAGLIFWFELQLLQASGLAPQLGPFCPVCGCALADQPGMTGVLALARGSLVCVRCAATTDGPRLHLPPDAIALLRAWQQADDPGEAMRVVCQPHQGLVLSSALGAFLQYHLEACPVSRELALKPLLTA